MFTNPYGDLFARLESYLDENYEFRNSKRYKGIWGWLRARSESRRAEEWERLRSGERYWHPDFFASGPQAFDMYYKQYLEEHEKDNFSVNLMRLIDKKGFDHVEVYKKARIDRRLFSKIRTNHDYLPSKRTALALAIAMRLDLEETGALLRDAGYQLSRSILFDVILEFFIVEGNYDMDEINMTLATYGLEPF